MKFFSFLYCIEVLLLQNGYNNFTDTCNSAATVKTEDLTDGGACVRGDLYCFW